MLRLLRILETELASLQLSGIYTFWTYGRHIAVLLISVAGHHVRVRLRGRRIGGRHGSLVWLLHLLVVLWISNWDVLRSPSWLALWRTVENLILRTRVEAFGVVSALLASLPTLSESGLILG